MEAIKRVLDGTKSCTSHGTTYTRIVADLRGHHATQKRRSMKYASNDLASVARVASEHLRQKRSRLANLLENGKKIKLVPLPGRTTRKRNTKKENTKVHGRREPFEPKPSRLSSEICVDNPVSQGEFEEMQDIWQHFCDLEDGRSNPSGSDPYINTERFNEEEVILFDSTMEEPDDYDIEMANAEREMLSQEHVEPDDYDIEMANAEREMLSQEHVEPVFQIPGLPFYNPVIEEEARQQVKRKGESVFSPRQPSDGMAGIVHPNGKRRKVEIGASSCQSSPPKPQKKGRKDRGGKHEPNHLFRRSGSLAAVFQGALGIGPIEQLTPLDLELLEEKPSNSMQMQTQPSVEQDLEVVKAETLYLSASQDDIHQGNPNPSELGSIDREALKPAFGDSGMLQPPAHAEEPSPVVTTRRTPESSGRKESLRRVIKHDFKRKSKPTGPSKKFQSFFATRRQRKALLRQGEASWDEEDASFIRSGQKFAEPGARLGAELVAKRLLDGRKTPLKRLVKDSQMSSHARRRRDLQRSDVKKVSPRKERMLAQMEKSGLNPKKEETKAEKKSVESIAKMEMAVSNSKAKVPGSNAPPCMPDAQWREIMSEVEEEVAKWEKEELQHRENVLLLFRGPFLAAARAVWPSGAWSGME